MRILILKIFEKFALVKKIVWKNQWSSIQDKTFEIEARPDILDYFFSSLVPFNYNFRR